MSSSVYRTADVLTQEQLDFILALPSVIEAKIKIDINSVLIAGHTLISGVRRGVMSYSDYIRMQMAFASKR